MSSIGDDRFTLFEGLEDEGDLTFRSSASEVLYVSKAEFEASKLLMTDSLKVEKSEMPEGWQERVKRNFERSFDE